MVFLPLTANSWPLPWFIAVSLKMSHSLCQKQGLPEHWQGTLHIAVNPKPQTVRPGENFTLRCVAFGIPTPQYQWYRNGQGLKGKTRDTLQVTKPACDCVLSAAHTQPWLMFHLWPQTEKETLWCKHMLVVNTCRLTVLQLNMEERTCVQSPTSCRRDGQKLWMLMLVSYKKKSLFSMYAQPIYIKKQLSLSPQTVAFSCFFFTGLEVLSKCSL